MTIRKLGQKLNQLAQYKRPVYTQQFTKTKRSTDPTVGMDMIQIFRGFKDDFCGGFYGLPNQIGPWWETRSSGTGGESANIGFSAHGGDLRMITGVGAEADNDYIQIDFNGNNCVSCGRDVRSYMIWKTKVNLNITQVAIVMGLIRTSTTPDEFIVVDFDTDSADANWYLHCQDNGGSTRVDTGLAVDTVDHWFRLIFGATYFPGIALDVGWVELYIDDMFTPIATCDTHVTLWNCEPIFKIQTRQAATTADMSLDFVAISPDAGITGVTP